MAGVIRVAFLGSHPLGEECLRLLADHSDISVELVVTYPPAYDSWWDGSVHEVATEHGYPLLTTEQETRLTEYPVDYLISVYYPNILGAELLDHPSDGALNLHQAELPRYRGSNVFSHAIMNARSDDHWKYGTTLHFMTEEVDAGDIVDRRFVPITETDTARTLYEKTERASIELFEAALPWLVTGEVHEMRTSQSSFEGERYFYTKASLDDAKEIPVEKLTDSEMEPAVYDRIRALDFPPFEPAYTHLYGETVYLTRTGYERPS